ncbi:hypothetical protein NliqN6_0286 [Naganishia liquefaciens]|uniref:Yeast cell wall synthesis Kre9/Knh1-like N-terminal domain-containing protein n=1 Tax=Naganishia liquefaciens TaxID=104408 RepID=A0A8H3TPC7_9TREE|nr:hypothetical protein NliqN6_0286 [Naganishia liquefaciens]
MTASAFNRLHALLLASLTLASSALAGVYITNPVANTTAKPGELLMIRWVDDGTTPHLASIGPSQIALYTGSATQQTLLQQLAANIDVSTANSVDAWIDANVGPSGEYYFIRITSNSLKDAAQPQYPYQSYSARFTLNNMTGDFNASVWQQLTAPPSAPSTAEASSARASSTASQSQNVESGVEATPAVTSGLTSGARVDEAAATTAAATTGTNITSGIAGTVATNVGAFVVHPVTLLTAPPSGILCQ